MPPSTPQSPRAPDARTDPELRKLFTHVQTGLQAEADLRVKPKTRQKKLLEKSVELGRKAEAELIRRYTYLTRVLHADFARTLPAHVDREDLFAVAQMAALEQIRKYRFDRGGRFCHHRPHPHPGGHERPPAREQPPLPQPDDPL